MAIMNKRDKEITVAIQGVRGSFHDLAVSLCFSSGRKSVTECDSFEQLFDSVKEEEADFGLVAFENSVAGSILSNYGLLRSSKLTVEGEINMRIIQNLTALPGEQLHNLREIHSHPMAIQQCSLFLDKMRREGVKVLETVDTALSACDIRREEKRGIAAIASAEAARIYGLDILQEGIEDDPHNYTRFLIISRNKQRSPASDTGSVPVPDKAMICFSLPHSVGSLAGVLSVLASCNISLTRIESLPIAGRVWEYLFYTDLIFSDYNYYCQAIEAIRPLTYHLEILGEFNRGTTLLGT